ncbi:MAG: bifunctional riboflavin kinase/FAD synthetase [Gammaproteobacteria bacterium]
MELIRGAHNLRPRHRGCVATIGNFDGVHRGHQHIVAAVSARARELGVASTVMLFEPQPQEFFAGARAPARLMRLRDKLAALAALGVDRVFCVRFDESFRALTAGDFVERLLVEGLGVRHLAIGDDFRFGAGRHGDYTFLCEAGARHGFTVQDTATIVVDGERVSSTAIRDALAAGDFDHAASLLGHPYEIAGRVRHGDARGRELGFPTANIALHRLRSPLFGVYAVEIRGINGVVMTGVANVGRRPTVNGLDERLEVHVFDFMERIYGRHITVRFLARIRDEMRFDGLDALKAQIACDVAAARAIFAARATPSSGTSRHLLPGGEGKS